jgi:uncharacterized protein YdiU (UPF0061 family)
MALKPKFGWTLEDHYGRLPPEFYTHLLPEAVGADPALIHANPAAAALIDLDPAAFATPEFARIFSGHAPLAGFSPLAMAYSGHQFGVWAGQLGDGRALLIAQIRNRKGELWDVQLKGAGRTPYSRFGDGRAVLRSSIREYLCSEAMAALGIPTTRALAIVATHEGVQRETMEPGAVLTRLSQSHIRFGHFEHFHHTRRDADAVRLLADHVIAEHFPGLDHAAWFAEVVRRTAQMIAAWQAVGFSHGVMNTDNMSILGLTMDYGPYGFMEAFEPQFICNHSDEGGRYAFDRQPAIGHWNLRALALALTTLIPEADLIAGLNLYEPAFSERYNALMRAKLGLAEVAPEDNALINELLELMAANKADYTNTFRFLSRLGDAEQPWLDLFIDHTAAKAWLEKYRVRVKGDNEALARMDRANPKYVLRNWIAETAIRAVEDKGDIATLDRIFKMLQSPFDEQPENATFAAPPPEAMRGLEVSCSS